ncbi:helix-turn-helix domain-containing protein [Halorientalis halophila]|uniref:helix-turn-helix domain-containing protein n=1 Tax=Halorientalis halophila TaxID=3108499 RepID=UPI0030089155
MSQSPSAIATGKFGDETATDATAVDRAAEIQHVLDALDDTDCRAILDAASEDARSANELSDACDLPLSTTYRKLELLTDAGLLEERTRLSATGKHSSEYVRAVDDVVVSLGSDGGSGLEVTCLARSPGDR